MLLTKDQKKNLIDDFSQKLSKSKATVFTNYQGMTVNDITELRKKLREKEIDYKIVKNSLIKIALKNNNIAIDEKMLDQPSAVAFGYNDEVEPNKIVYEFSKKNEKLKIIGALVNQEFVDSNMVKSLAMLPSRQELLAKVVGSISAPISGLINVMSGNLRGLVSVLKQYSEQKAK